MVIRSNIPWINSYRNLNKNRVTKALEKLSSGYRINRAADDASGLAVSEGMRAMITGIESAEENVDKGIALVQTADGAMQEIHSMLNRMYELSTKAANGIYTPDNRQAIQDEVDQLRDEINRISETTDFNGIFLIRDHSANNSSVVIDSTSGLPSWVTTGTAMADGKLTENFVTQETFVSVSGISQTISINHAAGSLDFSNFNAANKSDLFEKGFYTTCFTCDSHYSIKFTNSTTSSKEISGNHYIFNIGIANVNTADDLVQAIIAGTNNGNPNGHFSKFVADPTNSGKLIVYDDRSSDPKPAGTDGAKWPDWDNPSFDISANTLPNNGKFGQGIARSPNDVDDPDGTVILQIGPSPDDRFKVVLPNASLRLLQISNVSALSADKASASLEVISEAIDYLSSERSRMGAYQNALESRNNYLMIMKENLGEAESRIRNADMSKEMLEYTQSSILQQTASAMLAQANLNSNRVLSLVQ